MQFSRRKSEPDPVPAEGLGRPPLEHVHGGASGAPNQQRSGAKWSWRLGWGIASAGILVVAVSLFLGAGWADAGLSLGSGLALAGFVLLLERHLLQAVGAAIEESAAPLVERLNRIENLQEMQDRLTADRAESDLALTEEVRNRPTFENVASMLERAQELRLFDDIHLRGVSGSETLVGLTWEDFESYLYDAYPDFDPSVLEENPHFQQHILIRCIPTTHDGPSASSEWWPTQTLEEAWKAFLDACEKEQVPTTDINLGLVFEQLASSYSAMTAARRSASGHPDRLQGSLVMIANSEWAITTAGLESRKGDLCLPTQHPKDSECPEGHDDSLWQEALVYAAQFAGTGGESDPSP